MKETEAIARELVSRIFRDSPVNFEKISLEVFQFQYNQNPVYREYCNLLKKTPEVVKQLSDIPFLPVQLFKTKIIKTTEFIPELVFESSGTTGTVNSVHYIKDKSVYEASFLKAFELQYGDTSQYCIIGLLPSYLEKGNSSLVYMVKMLIEKSNHAGSGFYLYNFEELHQTIKKNESAGVKTLLIGVRYALLDFAQAYPMQLPNTIVIETGGMKGRKREMSRLETYQELYKNLQPAEVHSEYGMTEMLSQAYSKAEGLFQCAPWMKVLARKEDDPFEISSPGTEGKGVANIIDLANIYSCAFISTEDRVHVHADGTFEVLGRLQNSDLRGCGLMIAEAGY